MDDADEMLKQGIKRGYDDVFCLIEHAKLAETRGDFEAALTRWQFLRDVQDEPTHPSYQNGTIGLAQCLRTIGRFDDAEAVLVPFINRFGVQEVTMMELALIAEGREDWEQAITRWARVKNKFPMLTTGYQRQISALKHLGRMSAIDEVMLELIDRFPDALWAARDYAAFADEMGDKAEFARRWTMVVQRFPDSEAAFTRAADALREIGQVKEADKLLAEHPKHLPA